MLLMLGDLSLRRTGTNGCEDSVVIRYHFQDDFDDHGRSMTFTIPITREEGSTLLELCGDLASPVTVQSYSHQLEVDQAIKMIIRILSTLRLSRYQDHRLTIS